MEDGVAQLKGGFCPFRPRLCRADEQGTMCIHGLRAFEHQGFGHASLKCQPCCAEKAQVVKEAAKKPGEHRRGLTISAAVVIVAIGIYLVCPAAESPMSAENLPDSRKISADMCSGSAWDPLHQSLGQFADCHTVHTTSDEHVLETQVKPAKLCQGCQALSAITFHANQDSSARQTATFRHHD